MVQRRDDSILRRRETSQNAFAGVDDDLADPAAREIVHELDEVIEGLPASDPDATLDGNISPRDSPGYRGYDLASEEWIEHELGAEAAVFRLVRGTPAVLRKSITISKSEVRRGVIDQVDLLEGAEGLADVSRLSQRLRVTPA